MKLLQWFLLGMLTFLLSAFYALQPVGVAAQDEVQDTSYVAETSSVQLVVRAYYHSQQELDEIVERLDVFEEPPIDGYIMALVRVEELDPLRNEGFRLEIDAARTAEFSAQVAQVKEAGKNRSSQTPTSIPGFACYRTVEDGYRSLAALANQYPTLATWQDIGDSWEKKTSGGNPGYDINALVLTNREIAGPKPKFFLMAAIHAREYATAELATRFAESLLANYGVDPAATWLLDHFEAHIVPHANPDGRKIAEGGDLWRKNTNTQAPTCASPFLRGIDLNRNSSFMWGGIGASTNVCDLTYRGVSAASEPETNAIESYAKQIFPDQRGEGVNALAPSETEDIFISLHSYSELVLFPWGFTTSAAPNITALQTLGRKFGYFNGYQVCNGPACLYATSGTTDDYTYGELGVASYTFEVGKNFFESCSFFENNILPKNMPALYYAFKAARRPYLAPSGPDVLAPTVEPAHIVAGMFVTLTARVDDTRYNSNGWGTEPTQTITAAHYTLDLLSWGITNTSPVTGTATGPITSSMTPVSMSAADGAFDTSLEEVRAILDTTGWTIGRHILFLEGADAKGQWGVPSAVFVDVAEARVGVRATIATPIQVATPGSKVVQRLQIMNTGIQSDSFQVRLQSDWPATALPNTGKIEAFASTLLSITTTIPLTQPIGTTGVTTITLISQNDQTISTTQPLRTVSQLQITLFPIAGK